MGIGTRPSPTRWTSGRAADRLGPSGVRVTVSEMARVRFGDLPSGAVLTSLADEATTLGGDGGPPAG